MTTIAYKCRWSQRDFTGTNTGSERWDRLDEVIALCKRVNQFWKGEVTQWPIAYSVGDKGGLKEERELAHLV